MRWLIAPLILFLTCGLANAQKTPALKQATEMGLQGDQHAPVRPLSAPLSNALNNIDGAVNDIPVVQLSSIARKTFVELGAKTRSAKDAQIYRAISPSVVLIATKSGLGSGSLVDTSGDVITNWHVVRGFEYVAVIFKPSIEGKEPTRDDMKLGRVTRYDEIADLALIKVTDIPIGRMPIRLGDSSEIAVGADVHAIGHPTGEAWTYTTGVISQYRQAYEWKAAGEKILHKADIIQTQTPINPGNSGGPLIGDSGNLIGVNSFKTTGEGLNFAVSVDDVRNFLARSGNRIAAQANEQKVECTPKEISRFRNKENNATIIAFDMFCDGKDTGEYVIPDKQSEAIFLRVDRNKDGRADVIFFDLKRRGKWDISWWDEKFDGHWTLVGYHDDGSLRPSRFESFEAYQRRLASR